MTSLNKLSLVTDKAQYKPYESVRVTIDLKTGGEPLKGWSYEWSVMDLHTLVLHGKGFYPAAESHEFAVTMDIPPIRGGAGAYGIFVTVTDPQGERMAAETAFDVEEHWREAPRYGFLNDFGPEEAGHLDDVEFLQRLHINIVQFYDWMYRHDKLLPETEEFTDPLGRRLSHLVVREKIAALRGRGISSIAYAAVYASLPDYIEQHPEQGLYQNDGKCHTLGNYFHIMDISEDSEWTTHILREFGQVIDLMHFDGLHLDQYGMPKKAIRHKNGQREVVELKKLYPRFIDVLREGMSEAHSDVGLIFNNVSNYPTHTTATAQQDIMYIEVWDPVTHLRDLKQVIDNARKWSGKQVVLAAYLPSFHPEQEVNLAHAEVGATLAMATIFASGGYHLLAGEQENVLADPYYPKYGKVSERFKQTLQRYYDFIVMYRNLLYDQELDDVSMAFTGGVNTEVVFSKEGCHFTPNQQIGTIWTFVKEKPGYLILHLINLCGVENDVWHEGKKTAPTVVENIEIKVELWEEIEGIYCASPDGASIRAESLEYDWVAKGEFSGNYIRFQLPHLAYWSMVYIKTRAGVAI